jgi:hypothetical protein
MIQPQLFSILEDEGFLSIAQAIRRSTVSLAYKDKKERRYNLRYGLGQELMRKSQYADEFLQELTEFIHAYNDETMRMHERTEGKDKTTWRKLVTTQDIEHIVKLIDQYGSKTICNLLVACGYARDVKEQSDGT